MQTTTSISNRAISNVLRQAGFRKSESSRARIGHHTSEGFTVLTVTPAVFEVTYNMGTTYAFCTPEQKERLRPQWDATFAQMLDALMAAGFSFKRDQGPFASAYKVYVFAA